MWILVSPCSFFWGHGLVLVTAWAPKKTGKLLLFAVDKPVGIFCFL